MTKSICIIGYGAMGRLLEAIFLEQLPANQIFVLDPACTDNEVKSKLIRDSELSKQDLLILSVPSSSYESLCTRLSNTNLKPKAVVVSIAAVMESAAIAFEQLKTKDLNLILTHPLFGPASYEQNNSQLAGLKLAVHNMQCDETTYNILEQTLNNCGIETISVSPAEHDQQMSVNHFVPYFLSHALKGIDFPQSNLLTHSGKMLLDFANSSSENKSVLSDIYQENAYAKKSLELFLATQKTLQEEIK